MKGIFCVAVAAWLAVSLGQPANAAEHQNDEGNEPQKHCRLGNGIKQIVYLQFDNTHLKRDNPAVPSDLEQMPTLYNFLKDNGTLGSNSHTVLISHTAAGIISTLTGVYPDRTGTGLSNSFNYYVPDGTAPFISTFGYWTNIIPDSAPLMVDEEGKIAPAPWVPFTRAGCDVGNVSVANTVLENNSSDVVNVFGADSPEASEAPAQKTADFVGIAIHRAQGSSSICAAPGANPKADALPDAMASIKYSTANIRNTSPTVYDSYLRKMANFTERRDALAAWITAVLEGAAFDEDPVNPGVAALLATEANLLVAQMKAMAAAAAH